MSTAPRSRWHPPPQASGDRPRPVTGVVSGAPRLRRDDRVRRGGRADGRGDDPPQRRSRPRVALRSRPSSRRCGLRLLLHRRARPRSHRSARSPPHGERRPPRRRAPHTRGLGAARGARSRRPRRSASTPFRWSCPTRRSSRHTKERTVHAVDAWQAPAQPVQLHRHAGRVVGALIAFGSTPTLRCWSGKWWLPSQHRAPGAELAHLPRIEPATSSPRA